MYDGFLNDLAKLLEIDAKTVAIENRLQDFKYWDSLTIVSTLGLIDQYFGKSVSGLDLHKCQKIRDIFDLINDKKQLS